MATCLLLVSLILCHILLLVSSHTNPSDISALKAFKSLISTSSITPGTCLWSWDFQNTPDPCHPTSKFQCGILCDPSGRVTHITLDNAGYSGRLSPALSSLSSLISLDLSENHFFGSIPASLSSLSNLQNLVLRSNKFSGQIPASVLFIPKLETIDLSQNSLSGSLPDLTSPNLQKLDVSFNKLTGSIPKLPANLLELVLRGNQLRGELPKASFAKSAQLVVVDLALNVLTGTVPQWVFLLRSLQQVNLVNNSFTNVEIPKPINSNLVAIDMGFNKIKGLIPENLSGFPHLASVSLRYNQLHGPIPSGLGRKGSSLTRLFLDGNFLSGVLPKGVFSGVGGSLGDNCLANCPASLDLCDKPQKPASLCKTK